MSKRWLQPGLTLVELIISMAIMGMILLSVNMMWMNIQKNVAASNVRMNSSFELSYFVQSLRQYMQKSSQVSPASTSTQLLFTTVDTSNNPILAGYRINGTSLEMTVDGGTTWGSPYSMAAANTYTVTAGKILYCGYQNNCTEFTTPTSGTLASGYTGTALAKSTLATKVVFKGFSFQNKGITRTLPDLIYHLGPRYISMDTNQATSLKTPLVQSFSTTTTNTNFASNVNVLALSYDMVNRQLLVAGDTPAGTIYKMSRDGVAIGAPIAISTSTVKVNSLCVLNDNQTAVVLDSTANNVYQLDMTSGQISASPSALSVTTLGLTTGTATSIACDASTADDFYIIGKVSGSYKILRRNRLTGAASSTTPNSWPLPAAITNPTGMFVEPLTGDFYIAQKDITGTGTSRVMTIYRVPQTGTGDSFTINLDALGDASTTANAPVWGLAYEPFANRLYLSDSFAKQVYEVMPNRFITPQN